MRIPYDIVVFFAVLFAPFWSIVLLCLFGMYIFPRWYEIIITFALFEFLFHAPLPAFMMATTTMLPLSFYALITLIGVEWLRDRVRE